MEATVYYDKKVKEMGLSHCSISRWEMEEENSGLVFVSILVYEDYNIRIEYPNIENLIERLRRTSL